MAEFDALTIQPGDNIKGWQHLKKELDIYKANQSLKISTDNLLISTEGKIGIGTTTPAHQLDIVRNTHAGLLISGEYEATIRLFTARKDKTQSFWGTNGTGTTGKGNKGWMIQSVSENHPSSSEKGDLRFYYHDDQKWIQALSIEKDSMNIGMGTNNPIQELHIYRKQDDNVDIRLQNEDGGATDFFSGSSGCGIWSHGEKEMIFGVKNTRRLTINRDGKVGIGTATPATKLEVNGTIKTNYGLIGGTDNHLRIYNNTNARNSRSWIELWGNHPNRAGELSLSGSYISFRTNSKTNASGTEYMRILANGYIGIGTTNPSKKLHVKGEVFAENLRSSSNTTVQKKLTVNGLIEAKGRVNQRYGAGYYKGARTGNHKGSWDSTKDPVTNTVSIYAHDRIVGNRIVSCSDARLKIDVRDTSEKNLLKMLNKLEIKKYKFKKESHLEDVGFIAQEVESLLPQAVDKIEGIAPNICTIVKSERDKNGNVIVENSGFNISVGDIVRLHTDAAHDVKVMQVTEKTFTVESWSDEIPDTVFLYGTKMKDLRAIDYRYIFTMNVAATQFLSQQMNLLKNEISQIKIQIEKIRKEKALALI